MDIKNIIKIFFLIIILGLLCYLYTVKIPILCLACEDPGFFTRCIEGTGNNTQTCTAYKLEQKIVNDVENAYIDVSNQFGKVTGVFDDVSVKIKEAKIKLIDAFTKIGSLKIENISPISIPTINNIVCPINFDGIPDVDICKSGLTPSLNQGAITPINTTLSGLQTQINTVVGQLNNSIIPINSSITNLNNNVGGLVNDINTTITNINSTTKSNIPSLKQVKIDNLFPNFGNTNATIPQINTVNLSCDINLPSLIKEKLGVNTLDTCSLLVTQINNTLIPQLNTSFKIVEESINTTIHNINSNIQQSVVNIQNGITTALVMLETQLDALNALGQLSQKIVGLVYKMEQLNPMGLIKTYILPYIQAYFPFATLSDTITFLIFMLLIPFLVPLFLIINYLINLIPDTNGGE